jgi:hypothetical protein
VNVLVRILWYAAIAGLTTMFWVFVAVILGATPELLKWVGGGCFCLIFYILCKICGENQNVEC